MTLFKRLLLVAALLPSFAFADPYEANYHISTNCYGAFRVSFGMLPYFADELNAHAGEEVLLIGNVKVPAANPSTYELTIAKSLRDFAVGDYKLHQQYVNGILFLQLVEMPVTYTDKNAAHLWASIDRFFENCKM